MIKAGPVMYPILLKFVKMWKCSF